MSEEKPEVQFGEFKGNKTITVFINNNPKYPFSFGLSKAKAILEYIEEIKQFVKENDKPKE